MAASQKLVHSISKLLISAIYVVAVAAGLIITAPDALARKTKIAVLVNDEPITTYEISQQLRLMSGKKAQQYFQSRAKSRWKSLVKSEGFQEKYRTFMRSKNPQSEAEAKRLQGIFVKQQQQAMAASLRREAISHASGSLRKKAVDELVNRRLQLQEARRLNVLVSDDEVDKVIESLAQQNKLTKAQFLANLKKQGADTNMFKDRFRAMLSWRNVIRRLFSHQVSVSQGDVDRHIAASGGTTGSTTQVDVQRVTLIVPNRNDQASAVKRQIEGEQLRQRFSGCKDTGKLTKDVGAARFDNLGLRNASSVPEPTRTLLLSASDGEMLPPQLTSNGVELWILCGRKSVDAKVGNRAKSQESLRRKEFEVLAKRHLMDLRQRANIEHRE